MTNVLVLNRTEPSKDQYIESKIKLLKHLKEQMKEYEQKYEFMKEQLINEYFINNDEFRTEEGIILATYQKQNRSQFNLALFKKEKPLAYSSYVENKESFVFLLK